MDSRRVLTLGAAGLVPAALVTLLLVHQPSIGARRLYPMVRGSIALLGLCLALATAITWASSPNRLSRSALCGLAWAGVSALLCLGPLLESTPRTRLYALALDDGDVEWESSRAVDAPTLVDGVIVVTDTDGRMIGLEPQTGRELWRDAPVDPEPRSPATAQRIGVVNGHREAADGSWALRLPGASVLVVAEAGDSAYAYVSTPGADGFAGGAILKVSTADGELQWLSDLPAVVAVTTGIPAIAANDTAVVVAGGERIAALGAVDGKLRWTQGIVNLGKSRGYALPGAVQQVIVDGSLVFLSATADT